MSQEWLSRLERGLVGLPRKTTMARLATGLGIDIAELYVAAGTAQTLAGAAAVAKAMPSLESDDPAERIAAMASRIDWSIPGRYEPIAALLRMYREDDVNKRREQEGR